MTRRTIPYAVLADLHRPALPTIRREALALLAQGLSPRDVAQALRVDEAQVAAWIAEAAAR